MGTFDIIVIAIICVAVLAVIGTVIYKKIKHKGGGCGCGCGCEGCSSCNLCEKNGK